jgi:Prolyl oligopeptidase family
MTKRKASMGCLACLLALCPFLTAHAADPPPARQFHVPAEAFMVDGHPAFMMLPAENLRAKPQPWIWYFITLPVYPDEHEKWMDEQFLAAGIAVAGIDVGESFGSPAGNAIFEKFYEEMTTKRGFAQKPCLLGRSRGGLQASSWAIGHPDRVAGIAGIYPVFDFRSFPNIERAAPAYGLTPEELGVRQADFNPIERADVLAKARVPVSIIHGDVDVVVPLEANSASLVKRYTDAGAKDSIELIVANGQGHNYWEGFFRCQPLIDFAIAHARGDAKGN